MAAEDPDPITTALATLKTAADETHFKQALKDYQAQIEIVEDAIAKHFATGAETLENILSSQKAVQSCRNYQATRQLAERLKIRRQLLIGELTPDDRRALLQNAQTWAVHFSTVRMTVSTFLIGMIWAVFNLKSDAVDVRFLVAVVFLAAITAIFMFIFTAATHRKMGMEKAFRKEMRRESESASNQTLIEKGRQTWALLSDDWSLGVVIAVLIVLVGWIALFFPAKDPAANGLDANLANLGSALQGVADNLHEMNGSLAANQRKVADLETQMNALHDRLNPVQAPPADSSPKATAAPALGSGT